MGYHRSLTSTEWFAPVCETRFRSPSLSAKLRRMTFHEHLPLQSFSRSGFFPACVADPSLAPYSPPKETFTNQLRTDSRARRLSEFPLSLFTTSIEERPPAAQRSHSTLRSVLGVPPAFDGFLRSLTSWACFIPQPCPGFSLQGFDLQCRAVPGRPRPVPSCRSRRHPTTEVVWLGLPSPPVTEVTPEEPVPSSRLCSLHRV